jgi:hypothetical protein
MYDGYRDEFMVEENATPTGVVSITFSCILQRCQPDGPFNRVANFRGFSSHRMTLFACWIYLPLWYSHPMTITKAHALYSGDMAIH